METAQNVHQVESPEKAALVIESDRSKLQLYPATYYEQKNLLTTCPNPVFLFNVQNYRWFGGGRAFVRMPYNRLGNASRDDLTKCGDALSAGPLWNQIHAELDPILEKLGPMTQSAFGDAPPGQHEPVISAIQAYNPGVGSNFNLLRYFFDSSAEEAYQNNVKALTHAVEQALELPRLMPHPIPLLQAKDNKTLVMTQQQVFSLVANAFLCTFGPQWRNYPEINFVELFTTGATPGPKGHLSSTLNPGHQLTQGDYTKLEKLQAVFNYFYQMYLRSKFELWSHGKVVTFERRYLADYELLDWARCDFQLSEVELVLNGRIEANGKEMLQVCFSNPDVGGGVFGENASMQEIRFSTSPELIAARLFSESLGEDEVLIVTGAEQFSSYEGSGTRFRCTGLYSDPTVTDACGRIGTELLLMDALKFHALRAWEQYSLPNVMRDLNKAYTGFMLRKPTAPRTPIATGNWGCGHGSHGDPELKFLLQWLAASASERKLVYFVFDNQEQADAIEEIALYLNKRKATVQILFEMVKVCASELVRLPSRQPRLFRMIRDDLRCERILAGLPRQEDYRVQEYGKGRRVVGKANGRVRPRKKQFEDLCRTS